MYIKKLKNVEGENLNLYVTETKSKTKVPVVIMFHGFTSKGNNSTNKRLVELLSEFGISSICVDLSGHGESEGKIEEQTITKAKEEIKVVFDWTSNQKWVDENKISILGSSFSGNAAILFAAHNNKLHSLVLKSPVTDYYDVRLRQIGTQKMETWKQEGKIILNDGTPSNYTFIEDVKGFDSYEEIKKIKCPLYVVQGDNDEDIPMEHVQRLEQILDFNKDEITIIKGADHGYTNKDYFNNMIELIVGFLRKDLLV